MRIINMLMNQFPEIERSHQWFLGTSDALRLRKHCQFTVSLVPIVRHSYILEFMQCVCVHELPCACMCLCKYECHSPKFKAEGLLQWVPSFHQVSSECGEFLGHHVQEKILLLIVALHQSLIQLCIWGKDASYSGEFVVMLRPRIGQCVEKDQ